MSQNFSAEFFSDDPSEKVPMHPEDYAALLEWVRAKMGWVKREGVDEHVLSKSPG